MSKKKGKNYNREKNECAVRTQHCWESLEGITGLTGVTFSWSRMTRGNHTAHACRVSGRRHGWCRKQETELSLSIRNTRKVENGAVGSWEGRGRKEAKHRPELGPSRLSVMLSSLTALSKYLES